MAQMPLEIIFPSLAKLADKQTNQDSHPGSMARNRGAQTCQVSHKTLPYSHPGQPVGITPFLLYHHSILIEEG
jgi:hypothetical protein